MASDRSWWDEIEEHKSCRGRLQKRETRVPLSHWMSGDDQIIRLNS